MADVSDLEMRDYLLGGLSPERQTELAELIHADPELQEELLAIKEELFDQYLAGTLTPDEQQYFLTHFLSSESGQQKLHFARLLRDYRNSQPDDQLLAVDRAPAPITPAPAPSPWFAGLPRNPIPVVSMIVVAGVLATVIVWVSGRKSPTTHTTAQKMLTLSGGSTRPDGSIQKLPAPAKHDRIKLELELAKSDFKKYQTQLFRENEALESQRELPIVPKDTHYVVPVTFTGDLLTPGDYKLKLCGVQDSGQPTYIDSYTFRVTAETTSEPDLERERLTR